MKYLALDLGSKRVGVAVGSEIASELPAVEAPKDVNFYNKSDVLVEKLREIIKSEAVDELVVGLPINELGLETEESAKIKKLCAVLEKELNIGINFVDETLTSFVAEELLKEQGVDRQEIQRRKDSLAAVLILEQFLGEDEVA